MEAQYNEIRPMYDNMEEKIQLGDFYDILESKGQIWQVNEAFKSENEEFHELMKNVEDSDLVFDKIECKKAISDYIKNNLILKIHTLEVLEVKEKVIHYY